MSNEAVFWESNNKGVNNSIAVLTLTAKKAGRISFDYDVECETNTDNTWDYFTVTVGSNVLVPRTGGYISIRNVSSGNFSSGTQIVFMYRKDSSVHKGRDSVQFSNLKFEENGVETEIDDSNISSFFDISTGAYTFVCRNTVVNLPLPYLEKSYFDYDGTIHYADTLGDNGNLKNFDSYYMTKSGTSSGKSACAKDNPYVIYISLKEDPKCIYQWIDEKGNTFTDDIPLEWWIKPIKIKKPDVWKEVTNKGTGEVEGTYYTGDGTLFYDYDGYAPSFSECWKLPSIETEYAEGKKYSDVLDITGTGLTKQYKANTYPISFVIKHPDSCSWITEDEDEINTEDYNVSWTINPIEVDIPKVTSKDFTYSGQSYGINQTAEDRKVIVENYDPKIMTQSGHTGSYSARGIIILLTHCVIPILVLGKMKTVRFP